MQASPEVEFKIGDKAVYPAQGVAEVISIDEKDIAGQRQRFYVLRILDTDRKIMVPVSNADAVGLRQVISEQEIREIFDILKDQKPGTGGEIQLTDAMLELSTSQPFHGFEFTGRTFDCGSKEGFVEANVAFALWRADMYDHVTETVKELMTTISPQ